MSRHNFRLQKLEEMLSKGDVEQVLSELTRLARDSSIYNETINISSRYNINQKEKQFIAKSDYDLARRQIILAITDLLNRIETDEDLLHTINYEGIRYIVGLDFGDAESSIAYIDITSNNRTKPTIYTFHHREKSVLSSILQDGDDGYLIGEEAIINCDDPKYLYVNFKKSPKTPQWKSNSGRIKDFICTLIEQFHRNNSTGVKPDNSLLYIGHPSGWDEQETGTYRQIFKMDAHLAKEVQVVSESRSALICARDHSDIPREVLKTNVLVIDIGSSTTDFTFLKNGIPQEIKTGKDFGCRLIDEAIKDWAIANHPNRDFWANHLTQRGRAYQQDNYLKLLSRIAKEQIFGGIRVLEKPEQPDFMEVYAAFVPILQDLNETTLMQLPLGQSADTYAGMTWEQGFLQLLNSVRQEIVEPVNALLVTGGGSKMPFVGQHSMAVFGVRPTGVYAGTDPAFAVSMGLAGYGKWKYQLERFHKDVADFCEEELRKEINKFIVPFTENIMKSIFPLGYDKFAKPRIRQFINGEIEMEVLGNSLMQYAGTEISEWLNNDSEGKRLRDSISKDFLPNLKQWLEKETKSICLTYGIPEGSLDIDFNIPPNLLQTQFTEFLSKIGTSIAKGSIGSLPVSARKRFFSWAVDERTEKVVSSMYSLFMSATLSTADIYSWILKLIIGEDRINDLNISTNPFVKSASDHLQSAFSEAIHKRAEEAELFII